MGKTIGLNVEEIDKLQACTGMDCSTAPAIRKALNALLNKSVPKDNNIKPEPRANNTEKPKSKAIISKGMSYQHEAGVDTEEIAKKIAEKYDLKPKTQETPGGPSTCKGMFCKTHGAMHDNPGYKKPKFQCRNCGHHIPAEQEENGDCPGCHSQKWKEIDWAKIESTKDEDIEDDEL